MKARGVRSPDIADALALTFAVKEFFSSWHTPKAPQGFEVGTPQLQRIDAPGIGDNDGFYIMEFDPLAGVDRGWMG